MTDTLSTFEARESWLRAAAAYMVPMIEVHGFKVPAFRVAVGFAPTGARQENKTILGVTLPPTWSVDKVTEIFVSPIEESTDEMLVTLFHELIHATVGCAEGHTGEFKRLALLLGFMAPMTTSPAGPALRAEMLTMVAALGTYPGAQIIIPSRKPATSGSAGTTITLTGGSNVDFTTSAGGTQTTRMLKVECDDPTCVAKPNGKNYSVRTTRQMLALGAPRCPMGHPMH